MRYILSLVLLAFVAGCGSTPPALPQPQGDYRPINQEQPKAAEALKRETIVEAQPS